MVHKLPVHVLQDLYGALVAMPFGSSPLSNVAVRESFGSRDGEISATHLLRKSDALQISWGRRLNDADTGQVCARIVFPHSLHSAAATSYYCERLARGGEKRTIKTVYRMGLAAEKQRGAINRCTPTAI